MKLIHKRKCWICIYCGENEKKYRLKWFGYVMRRDISEEMRVVMEIYVESK